MVRSGISRPRKTPIKADMQLLQTASSLLSTEVNSGLLHCEIMELYPIIDSCLGTFILFSFANFNAAIENPVFQIYRIYSFVDTP